MCDSEKASINSFVLLSENTIDRMFVNFTKCIWHSIQSGGQSTLYKDNETARSIFNMFAAFAFIKEDNVIRAYEALKEHICYNGFEQQFRELLNYYEDTFIERHHLEGLHNAFARLVGKNHPNIFKFLASLQRLLSHVDIKINTIHMRTAPQNTRPVYNQINKQLIQIMERRGTISIITLL
ncbi:hypothetical protein HZS_2807 [Henneguya salminicola]|nr:hypothetical protein HZS_2807 [Henneguya salminicola]